MQHSQEHHIEQLKGEIEQSLSWGSPEQWTGKDFDALSDAIQQQTGQAISVTTLKRLWGRVQSNNPPSTTTLDILSQFAGFAHWRDFKQSSTNSKNKALSSPANKPWVRSLVVGLALVSILIACWQGYRYFTQRSTVSASEVSLQVHIPTTGLPISVRIDYDLTAGEASDFQLISEGSAQESLSLSQSKGSASFTYYHPGYYHIELRHRDQLIQTEEVAVSTNGWMACLDRTELYAPIYLDSTQVWEDSSLHVSDQVFDLITQEQSYMNLWLENIPAEARFSGDRFVFESEVKLNRAAPINPCKTITYILHGTEEKLAFGFCVPGCTGDLAFQLAGQEVRGSRTDLSGFGLVGREWIAVRVEMDGSHLSILANDERILQHTMEQSLGDVGGVSIVLSGIGEVRHTAFLP